MKEFEQAIETAQRIRNEKPLTNTDELKVLINNNTETSNNKFDSKPWWRNRITAVTSSLFLLSLGSIYNCNIHQNSSGKEKQIIYEKENGKTAISSGQTANNKKTNRKIVEDNSYIQIHQTNNRHLTFSLFHRTNNFNLVKNTSSIRKLPYNENVIHIPILFKDDKPLGIIVGVSGIKTWDIPKGILPSLYYAPLNNVCFSLYYDISEHLRLGAEFRQETFYNKFTGIKPDKFVLVYQQSNLNSYGAKIIYYPLKKRLFNPYGGLILAYNPAGFIARPNAGIDYQPATDLAFTLGVEYSYYWFNHQNNIFYTSKIGIFYGITKKF